MQRRKSNGKMKADEVRNVKMEKPMFKKEPFSELQTNGR